MNQTVYEKGIEKGRREGRLELLCSLLEDRFGPVSTELREHLDKLPMEELRRLALKSATVTSLAELGLPAQVSKAMSASA